MRVCLVGKQIHEFVAEDTGELVEGVKLFYYAPKDEVEGHFAGEIWVPKRSAALYHKAAALELNEPMIAELTYDVQPGRRMRLTLCSIEVIEDAALTESA